MLRLTEDQKKQVGAFQKEVDGELDKLLTAEQKKQLREMPPSFGPGAPPAGQLLSSSQQDRLKLTSDQKKQVAAFQKKTDDKLDKLLTADQKKQLKDMRQGFGGGMVFGGGPGMGGPPGGNSIFRATRYGVNYAGFMGKNLTPGKTIEELQAKDSPKPMTR
jgi:hypothetical protein